MIRLDKRFRPKHFHVTIFGSARIKKNDKTYKEIYKLAEMIGEKNWDVVTGGGPGIMEAANLGHRKGNGRGNAHSIGLGITLPHEQRFNRGVQLFRKFNIFSRRLDHFMILSNAIVIAPGGVGTILELFYSWQLMQTGHTRTIPIILLGNVWKGLLKWLKDGPLDEKYFEKKDLNLLYHAKNWKEAIEIIKKSNEMWEKDDKSILTNYQKYRIK
ncbi:LOG family protein [Candidatus Pacearchaeota archaeon]|nr:LOG family protein [Candidatus Pacearchaeota archaeon]